MHEKISALLDGELDQGETEELLTIVARDRDLSATWQRYHLIRAAVRKEPMLHISGVAERSEIPSNHSQQDTEPVRLRPPAVRTMQWLPRLAIAASVAILLGFGLYGTLLTDSGTSGGLNTEVVAVDQATKWESTTPDVEHTLNAYLVEHGEFTPMSSMNGLMSYAKFVSYDSAQ